MSLFNDWLKVLLFVRLYELPEENLRRDRKQTLPSATIQVSHLIFMDLFFRQINRIIKSFYGKKLWGRQILLVANSDIDPKNDPL